MKIFNGPTKLGKVLPILLPYYFILFCRNVFWISSKGNIRGEHGKVQSNIERTILGETNLRRLQIDSFISDTYYEYAYGPEDHRHDLIHKKITKKFILLVSY